MQAQFGQEFPLYRGNAEQLPFPDASFDLAVSEYGASIWCDPYAWIPEAARVPRESGFDIEALIELQASEGTRRTHMSVTNAWARQWPSEEIWRVRKR